MSKIYIFAGTSSAGFGASGAGASAGFGASGAAVCTSVVVGASLCSSLEHQQPGNAKTETTHNAEQRTLFTINSL